MVSLKLRSCLKNENTTSSHFPCPAARWWGRGYGVLARQQSVRQSVQYRTERSRTGSLEDFTNSQCTTIPDYAGGCVDPTTIEYPLKECDTGTETSVKIESVKNECALECADGADLDQIKALLSSVDPDLLQKLLVEILKE